LVSLTGSSASGGSQKRAPLTSKDHKGDGKIPLGGLAGSGSDSSETGSVVMMQKPLPPPPPAERGLPPPPVPLAAANSDLGGSKQSFRMAMGNPCELISSPFKRACWKSCLFSDADDTLQIMGDLWPPSAPCVWSKLTDLSLQPTTTVKQCGPERDLKWTRLPP
jgi:hypothetical protein